MTSKLGLILGPVDSFVCVLSKDLLYQVDCQDCKYNITDVLTFSGIVVFYMQYLLSISVA